MRLDYIDSGIVLTAWRGGDEAKARAREFLSGVVSQFVSSTLLKVETFPKAAFRQHREEVDYYEFVYSKIAEWIPVDDALVEEAIELGRRYDVVNIDALHAAAAIRAGADRFITTERLSKPSYRLTEIEVVYLLDL